MIAALRKLLVLSRSIASKSIQPTLSTIGYSFSNGTSSPVYLALYQQYIFVYNRPGSISVNSGSEKPALNVQSVSGSADDIIWIHGMTVTSMPFSGVSSYTSSGGGFSKLVLTEESELNYANTTVMHSFLIPLDVIDQWVEQIKSFSLGGNRRSGAEMSAELKELKSHEWKSKYFVEKALRTRIAECHLKEIGNITMKSSLENINTDRFSSNQDIPSRQRSEVKVYHAKNLQSKTVMAEQERDSVESSALKSSYHLEEKNFTESKHMPSSLLTSRDVIPAKSSHSTSLAKVWTFSWNMGVKEYLKIPQDAPLNLQAQIKKRYLEEIRQVVPGGYDIYVIGVQECVSNRFFELFEEHLKSFNCSRIEISQEKDRVWGRGDGSFISPKFTGIAIFVSDRIKPLFKFLAAASSNLSLFEGSKGGAAVCVKIHCTTMVFISSHLPSKDLDDRRRGYRVLMKNLGNLLGDHNFELPSQFHHIVFVGDLNFRLSGISIEKAIECIQSFKMSELRKYDELTLDLAQEKSFLGFQEPLASKDFLPTYKKKEDRPEKIDRVDMGSWVDRTYRTQYKEPWYKSGKIQPRMPSFCDRIIFKSLKSSPLELVPEDEGSTNSQSMGIYKAINECFLGSDHSAVSCGFILKERNGVFKRNVDFQKKIVKISILQIGFSKRNFQLNPKTIRISFPAPWENGKDAYSSEIITQEMLLSSNMHIFSWKFPKYGSYIHLLVRVETESDLSGECVIPFSLEDFENEKYISLSEIRLYRHGMPFLDLQGNPMFLFLEGQLSVLNVNQMSDFQLQNASNLESIRTFENHHL